MLSQEINLLLLGEIKRYGDRLIDPQDGIRYFLTDLRIATFENEAIQKNI